MTRYFSDDEPTGNPMVTMDQESPDEGDMVVVYKAPSSEPESAPKPREIIKPQTSEHQKSVESSDDDSSDEDGYKPIETL